MRILGLDTATALCSVALSSDGVILEQTVRQPRAQTERLLPMIHGLLDEAGLGLRDLDAIAFGRGPGSFTGVRLATAVTQGLAFGAGLPVVPVSDLAALAQRAFEAHGWRFVLACLDARMMQVYVGAFEIGAEGVAASIGNEAVLDPQRVELPDGRQWYGAGPGWGIYPQLDGVAATLDGLDQDVLPNASAIARLAELDLRSGRAVAPEHAEPVYLRDRVATPRR